MMFKFFVRVGTDRETAHALYAEFAGENLIGGWVNRREAEAFVVEVKAHWEAVRAEHGDSAFVYGEPFAEVAECMFWDADRAAGNWYMVYGR